MKIITFHENIIRHLFVFFILFSFLSQIVVTAQEIEDLRLPSQPIKTFEMGKKYIAGGLKVVVLRGTWQEMGRQYGALLQDELKKQSPLRS